MSNTKKNIKVRDLKPSKDAKGGGVSRNTLGTNTLGTNTLGTNSHGAEGSSKNTHSHQHGGHGGHH
jgi:hypothetical protein